MSCRMRKYCWGDRFLEEDGNCGFFFLPSIEPPSRLGKLTLETHLNISRMSCLFLTVLGWTCSRKDLNMVAELNCQKESRHYGETWTGSASAVMVTVHARTHAHREHADVPSTSGKSFCLSRQTPSTCPNTEKNLIQEREKSYPWNVQARTLNVSLSPRVAVKQ